MISVIVPVYNTKELLPQCIKSIISQSYDNFELILVNDGSTDNSRFICDNYAKKDERIKVVHKKNEGVSVARNVGLKVAIGDYVWFVDSDDFMADGAMNQAVKYIENHNNVDIITCAHFNTFKDKSSQIIKLPYNTSSNTLDRFEYYEKLYKSGGAYWAPWKNIYKKSVIDKNNLSFLSDYVCAEDCDFFMKFLEQAEKFAFLNIPLIYYRTDRVGSVTNSMSVKVIKDRMKVYLKYYYEFESVKNRSIPNMESFFANKFANAISDFYHLKNPSEIKKINSFTNYHKSVLKDTSGRKYDAAKIVWKVFGFYNGSKLLQRISSKIK